MQNGSHLIRDAHRTIRLSVPNPLGEEVMECRIGPFDRPIKPGRREYDPRYFCVETYVRSEHSAVGRDAPRSSVRKLDTQRLPGAPAKITEYALANGDSGSVNLGMAGGRRGVAVDRIPENDARALGSKQHRRCA